MRESVRFVDNTLKTNYFFPGKTGLAFRLSPDVLDETYYPQRPYGIFFILGRDYRFFQVRWRDISRGGLRIVIPKNKTDYGYAFSGIFDEVYGLSLAQQEKNKDIPEGGSKAVMVLRPESDSKRAVRGAINALLDLIVQEDENHEENITRHRSYYSQEELIFLGPDENMTNDLITWGTSHAKNAAINMLMPLSSSRCGINHKRYGVTSQGLHVFSDICYLSQYRCR